MINHNDFLNGEAGPGPEQCIRQTLASLHAPGAVFEVRILGIRGRGKPHIASGYFDAVDGAVERILAFDREAKAEGIYTTLNLLNVALLARLPNLIQDFPKITSSDADVTQRRWLLLDFDPERPSGVSSTRQELDAAFGLADRTREWLAKEFGWPEPLKAMSGNGIHELQRVDLANSRETKELFERVLKAIAAKGADLRDPIAPVVKLDVGVVNAARLTKIYGTVARKGADTDERPHRRSRLIVVPETVEVVPLEKLEAVARLVSTSRQERRVISSDRPPSHRLDVGRWLGDRGFGFTAKSTPTADGRTVYLLDRCPFNPEHGHRGEVAVMQAPDGALSAKCFHDSCSCKGWKDFKKAIGAPDAGHFELTLGHQDSKAPDYDQAVSRPLESPESDDSPYIDLRRAMLAIANQSDQARTQNGVDFSADDSAASHNLADRVRRNEPWTIQEARAAYRICSQQWRLLRGLGINSEMLCDPAIGEGKKALRAIEESAKTDPTAAIREVLQNRETILDLAALRFNEREQFDLGMLNLRKLGVKARDVEVIQQVVKSKRGKKGRQELRADRHGDEENYEATDDGIVWKKQTPDGEVAVRLTNFCAWIRTQISTDNGVEQSLAFEIEARLREKDFKLSVSADEFAALGWVLKELGPQAVVFPGLAIRDRARVAIQLLSGKISARHVYAHTGWRKVGIRWVFLHAGGAIGPVGPEEGIEVALDESLRDVLLPPPAEGENLVAAIRATLRLLSLGTGEILQVGYCAVWRSVIGEVSPVDFTVHIAGLTGVFKTEFAALLQGFFGATFNGRRLPGSFKSTANANERLLSSAKDVLVVVDDFSPCGTTFDVAKFHRDADNLLRGVGNRSARGRLRADGTPRPVYTPRGLPLTTGEDIPTGHSLRARMLVLEVGPRDIDAKLLSRCQSDRDAGIYAKCMSAYLKWLAPRMDELKQSLRGRQEALRQEFLASAAHRRVPDVAASLMVGLEVYLRFAQQSGALSPEEVRDLEIRVRQSLGKVAAAQAELHASEEVASRFVVLLVAAISSGRCHLADVGGEQPRGEGEAERWGWRRREVGTGEHYREQLSAQGPCVGWIDGEDVYLDPDSALASAQRLAGDQGTSVSVSARTLWKRLGERGYLRSRDISRGRNLVRRTVVGKRRDVLHLATQSLADDSATCTGPIVPIVPIGSEASNSLDLRDATSGSNRAGVGIQAQFSDPGTTDRPSKAQKPSDSNPSPRSPCIGSGPIGPEIEVIDL